MPSERPHSPRTPTAPADLEVSPPAWTDRDTSPAHRPHRGSRPRRLTAGVVLLHLLGIVLSWGSVWVLARVSLGTRVGQWLDEQALQESHDTWGAGISVVGGSLRQALDALPLAAAAVAAIALLVLSVRSRRLAPAVVGIGVFGASIVTVQVLKRLVLDKPDYAIHEATMNSFPSGHTALAAAAGMVVLLATPARFRSAIALIAALVSLVAGASTVINAWHRPSDVIAALLVTAGWGLVGGLLLRASTGAGTTGRSRVLAVFMVVGGLLGVLIAGVVALLAYQGTSGAAVTSGMIAITAGSLLTWGCLALLLRHR